MKLIDVLLLMVVVTIASAQKPSELSPEMKAYFETVKRIIPAETTKKLEEILKSRQTPMEKAQKSYDIMNRLPDSILDQIPLPPPIRKLPKRIQDQIRGVVRSHKLTFQQHVQEVQRIIKSLTPAEKAALPKGLLPK